MVSSLEKKKVERIGQSYLQRAYYGLDISKSIFHKVLMEIASEMSMCNKDRPRLQSPINLRHNR